MEFNDERRLYDQPTKFTMKERDNKVECKHCGHTVEFWHGENKILCNWCNYWVYKNKKIEFEYKMKGLLRK